MLFIVEILDVFGTATDFLLLRDRGFCRRIFYELTDNL